MANPNYLALMTIAATLATGVVAAIVFGFLALRVFRERSKRQYRDELHRAKLSEMRANYEEKISDLMRRMVATPERWVDANHLVLDAQNAQGAAGASNVDSTRFLSGHGVGSDDLDVDPTFVFVLTPFHSDEERVYSTIKRVCEDAGLRCARGDEEYVPAQILTHIVKQIAKARLIIANITSRNSNVFFELGIAQALGKPTILVSESLDAVPFDVQSRRVLLYTDDKELEDQLRRELVRVIANT